MAQAEALAEVKAAVAEVEAPLVLESGPGTDAECGTCFNHLDDCLTCECPNDAKCLKLCELENNGRCPHYPY